MIETHKRSLIKAISWRVVATFTTMGIVFVFTRKFVLTLEVGVLEVLLKMFFYYIHERFWEKIKWGKMSHPLEILKVKKNINEDDLKKIKEQLKNMGYMD